MTFEELYHKQRASLRSYICRYVQNRKFHRDLCDDIEQETWVRIHRRWQEYDESRPFLPWAKGDVQNAFCSVTTKYVKGETSKYGWKENEEDYAASRLIAVLEEYPHWMEQFPMLETVLRKHHLQKPRVTLRNLAEEMDVSYSTIKRANKALKELLRDHYDRR